MLVPCGRTTKRTSEYRATQVRTLETECAIVEVCFLNISIAEIPLSLKLIGTPKLWNGDPTFCEIGTPSSQNRDSSQTDQLNSLLYTCRLNWHYSREWSQITENRDPEVHIKIETQNAKKGPIGTLFEPVQSCRSIDGRKGDGNQARSLLTPSWN